MTAQLETLENEQQKQAHSNHGGKRAGSGRKQKTRLKKNFKAREDLYWWIDENWATLLNGLKTALTAKDKEMIKYLIDQRIGKAPQYLELGGDSKKPITIRIDPAILSKYDSSRDTETDCEG